MNAHAYLSQVAPTYLENWPEALCQLSVAQVGIRLTMDEVQSLLQRNQSFMRKNAPDSSELGRVYTALDQALLDFPNGAFVRLGSRSAKDSFQAECQGLRVTSAHTAISMLTTGSDRVKYDLTLALRTRYAPSIFLRQWLVIPHWSEFRCFVMNNKLAGITQYDCINYGPCQEIRQNAEKIRKAITTFFQRFVAVSHLNTVVADVYVHEVPDTESFSVTLLELNPFGPPTDSCLFDWTNPADFDGTFRYL